MSGGAYFINLLGTVALLIWGMRLVSTGMSRAFGSELRQVISVSVSNRFRSFLVGVGVTSLLQSSTATSLLVSSFAARGLIATGPALAIMLGADVGTSLVAQVLAFDVSWLSPVLIFVGVTMHFVSTKSVFMQVGRIAIGLGIILLSLKLLVGSSQIIRDADGIRYFLSTMQDEVFLVVLLTGLLTWIAHSSLAIVLMIMSIASSGVIPVSLAIFMVLGANLGGVITPIIANYGKDVRALRVPIGNALFKLTGALIIFPFLDLVAAMLPLFGQEITRQIVNFHTFFNIYIVCVFILATNVMGKYLDQRFPDSMRENDPGVPQYLDRLAVNEPSAALASAEREAIRMGDIVEGMLNDSLVALQENDKKLSAIIIEKDDSLDKLYESIKLYVTEITRESLSVEDSRRATNLLTFTTNLEHIGDVLGNLMELVLKKIKKKKRFSDDGFLEITEIHERVVRNFRHALGVFISNDRVLASRLQKEKKAMKLLERKGIENHMDRLREGRIESIETSALHMDFLRDLLRIHSHIVAISSPALVRDESTNKN